MRQSASNHSLIPVRTNHYDYNNRTKAVEAPQYQSRIPLSPYAPSSKPSRPIMSATPQRGLGISVSPSRVPVRAQQGAMKPPSIFANATMVQGKGGQVDTSVDQNSSAGLPAARAPNPRSKLSEPFRTPIIGSKDDLQTPSPTYSSSISPSFIVRNLDEDPHTGLTPTVQTFETRKPKNASSRLSKTVQLPSPPESPNTSPNTTRSRLPRRSQDDLALTESSRKLQAASSSAAKPRRISLSVPTPLTLDILKNPDTEMTAALAPPAPITIPPNEYGNLYPSVEKPLPTAKSPGTIASFFRWNTTPTEQTPGRLQTPSTASSHPASPMTPTSPSVSALEQELRSVSADLAFSIRREMDLEDVITRLQDEVQRLGGQGQRQMRFRTSDYFSENSYQGSPPLRPVDDVDRKDRGHSRVSSVAVEDVRMANEKVTQLEKEILVLRHENLELMTHKRDVEKKLKDQRGSRGDTKKILDLEASVEQLRRELLDKTQENDALQKAIKLSKSASGDKTKAEEEIKMLTERAKGAESQREALQLALRQLRERQTLEFKKANERIKQLETEKERNNQRMPRTPERAVAGIIHRTPDSWKRSTLTSSVKNVDEKTTQLKLDLSNASKRIAALTVTNTQITSENTQLRDMQQRLQARLSQLESAASASTIGEASASASLSYAHRLAVEMARVTDIHIKSIEKVRSTANSSLPYLKNGGPLSPMLQNAYDSCFKSPKRLSYKGSPRLGEDATVKMMENRIKELEKALQESSEEMGEVVCKMQLAQIEMIELAGERDEAVRRERKLEKMTSIKLETDDAIIIGANNVGIPA